MINKKSDRTCDKIVEDFKLEIKTANSTVRSKLKRIQKDLLESNGECTEDDGIDSFSL